MVQKKEKGSKGMPLPDGALKQDSSGSMDYTSKQEKFERQDKSKISRGSFKDSRY